MTGDHGNRANDLATNLATALARAEEAESKLRDYRRAFGRIAQITGCSASPYRADYPDLVVESIIAMRAREAHRGR